MKTRTNRSPKIDQRTIDFITEQPEIKVEEIAPEEPKGYTIKVTHPSLRMRVAPSTQAEIVGHICDQGIYKIVDEVNGWGKLENGNWIMLTYTKAI